MRSRLSSWAYGLVFAVLAASSARAQDEGDWQTHDRVAAGQIQSLDRILPEIRRTHPGTFYDAEGPFPDANGEMHYRLKWMTPEGRVVWFEADARTGRVLGSGSGRRDYRFNDDNYGRGDYGRGDQGDNGDRRRFQDDNGGGRNWFGGGPDRDYPFDNGGGPPFGGGHGNGRGHGNDHGPGGGGGHDWGHDRGGWGGHGGGGHHGHGGF